MTEIHRPGRLLVVVGGQFGSEGKGHLAAQLGARMAPNSCVIRTGGPNAGHTVWRDGVEHKLRHLPTPIAMREDITPALAAKSVIDPRVLAHELERFPGREVLIDPSATVLEPYHIGIEDLDDKMQNIGSTRKGIGAARADRVRRQARTWRQYVRDEGEPTEQTVMTGVASYANFVVAGGGDVMIEAAQGYGLGLHTDFYPYCTSDDCTAIDALAAAQISPWAMRVIPEVWMAVRPFPIRVAGTSGPLRGETTWEELGLPQERTTVTNKVRRVGRWDGALARRAALANGVDGGNLRLGLLMVDQVVPEIAGETDATQVAKIAAGENGLADLIARVSNDTGAPVGAIGTGPATMVFAQDAGLVGF
jgi:adenylosuccinate synthase